MKFFVAILNPDPREKNPYSSYPKDYNDFQSILNNQSQNKPGEKFYECVNFLEADYGINGFIPAWENKAIRDYEHEFVLISISCKGNNGELNDRLIGIQAGCKYEGREDGSGFERLGPMPRTLKENLNKKNTPLLYNYCCYCERYSLNLFSEKIMNAAEITIGDKWDGSLIVEITADRFIQIVIFLPHLTSR